MIHNEQLLRIDICNMARWLSWLERRPVTAEVVGSSPIRVAEVSDSSLTDLGS